MGHYTHLRLRLRVKPKYALIYRSLLTYRHDHNHWDTVAIVVPEAWGFVREWANVYRCGFIPYGALNEYSWKPGEGWDLAWDEAALQFTFQCSIKNYGGEVQTFVDCFAHTWEEVLEGWYWYEEWKQEVPWNPLVTTLPNPPVWNAVEQEYQGYGSS